MSVRTWLAGQALAGLCAWNGDKAENLGGRAVKLADATIKELGL